MLTAAGSPLVAGSMAAPDNTMKRVKVIRAFMFEGKPQKVGDVVEMPLAVAIDAVAARRGEFVADAPAAVAVEEPPPARKAKEKGSAK